MRLLSGKSALRTDCIFEVNETIGAASLESHSTKDCCKSKRAEEAVVVAKEFPIVCISFGIRYFWAVSGLGKCCTTAESTVRESGSHCEKIVERKAFESLLRRSRGRTFKDKVCTIFSNFSRFLSENIK